MSERNLLDGMVGPTIQTIDHGKALAKFLGLKEELPEIIALANGARLILSSKKDCYYFTSDKGCTCKAGTYGRLCKHRKALDSSKPRGQVVGASRGKMPLESNGVGINSRRVHAESVVSAFQHPTYTTRGQSMAQTLEEHDRNLHKMPKSYQRMVRMAREEAEAEPLELIHKGGFKPVMPEEA